MRQHVLRIQIKSVFSNRPRDGHRFSVNTGITRNIGTPEKRSRVGYTSDDIDFIVAYVAPHNAWYVIPVDALAQRTFINLYPLGKTRSLGGAFEKYREAWSLLEPQLHRRLLPILRPSRLCSSLRNKIKNITRAQRR